MKLETKKGPSAGIFEIYLDGAKVSTFDSYSPSATYQVVAYQNTALALGSHSIRMVNTGTKNVSSSGTYVHLDDFVVV